MTPETEKLLQQWLKIEILKFKWSIVSRLVMIVLIIIGLIISIRMLEPIVSRQLTLLNTLQNSLLKPGSSNQGTTEGLLDFLNKQLTPEQRQELQLFLQEKQP